MISTSKNTTDLKEVLKKNLENITDIDLDLLLTSATWTCAKHWTMSLSLTWRDMDLTDGALIDKKLAGWLHSESCGQWLDVPVKTSDEWCSSGAGTWL